MSRLEILWEHGRQVRIHGSHGRGYIPNDIYERKILPEYKRKDMNTLPLVRAMIELIIDEGLNQCLD